MKNTKRKICRMQQGIGLRFRIFNFQTRTLLPLSLCHELYWQVYTMALGWDPPSIRGTRGAQGAQGGPGAGGLGGKGPEAWGRAEGAGGA